MTRYTRWIEDMGLLLAILIGVAYVGAEMGLWGQTPAGIPWGLLIVMAVLVAPKTLGRATAGKVWDAVSARLKGPS